jgi:uncharacterized membrane protein
MIGMGDLPGRGDRSTAYAVSADGAVIVGEGSANPLSPNAPTNQAFIWNSTDGMVGMHTFPDYPFRESTARGVSANGEFVVGHGVNSEIFTEAFRWSRDSGFIRLGDLPGGASDSRAFDVSADGSVIVGNSWGAGEDVSSATIWNEIHGLRALKDVLETDYNLDLTGWSLYGALAVSDDGMAITGYGVNPSGVRESWYANLRPVPEPSTLVLLALGAGVLPVIRRRTSPRRDL